MVALLLNFGLRTLGGGHIQREVLVAAHHIELHALTRRERCNLRQQLAHVFHGLARHFQQHVAGAQTRIGGWPVLQHASDDDAFGLLQPKGLGQLRRELHRLNAHPTTHHALILLISYAYIKMLGAKGLRESTEIAILNANYIAASLKGHYDVLYTGKNGTVAHEMILDCRDFKRTAEVEVADMAKRLIDFNFHAPTVSFPVAGTLMIEPTESEDKEELDRFILAMKTIRREIAEIENGHADKTNNIIKNAPHTADCIINRNWDYPYSPQEAAYPVEYLKEFKYWVPVRRVDNAFGDRNLVCSCPSMESYKMA